MHSYPFEEAFQSACDSGMLPGVILMAVDKTGKPQRSVSRNVTDSPLTQTSPHPGSFTYSKTMGVRSSKPENASKSLELDTVLAIASCTKLMTAIAALQCVERGLFTLDEDVGRLLPELGEGKEIISSFDEVTMTASLTPKSKPISLR